MASLTLRKSTNVDLFYPPLTPFGGTARREAGVADASLTTTPCPSIDRYSQHQG